MSDPDYSDETYEEASRRVSEEVLEALQEAVHRDGASKEEVREAFLSGEENE